jgi:hypothetical protein
VSLTDLWARNANAHEAELLDALGVRQAVAQLVEPRLHAGLGVVYALKCTSGWRHARHGAFREDQVVAMHALVEVLGADRARMLVARYPAVCVLLAACARSNEDVRGPWRPRRACPAPPSGKLARMHRPTTGRARG